jgi:hypothetical protein
MRAPRNSRRGSPVNNSHHRCRSRPLSITDPLTRDYGPAGHAGSSDPCRQAHRPAIVRTAISPGRPIRCSRASVHRRLGDRVNHHLDARGRSRSPPRARRKDYLVSSVPAGSTFRGEGSQYGRRTGRQGSSQGARCTPVDDLPQRGGAREARGMEPPRTTWRPGLTPTSSARCAGRRSRPRTRCFEACQRTPESSSDSRSIPITLPYTGGARTADEFAGAGLSFLPAADWLEQRVK